MTISKEDKQLAIELLAKGTPVNLVADKVGANRSTVYTWLDTPSFKTQLNRKVRDSIQAQFAFAVPEIINNIKVMLEIRDDGMNKPSIRLKAATELNAICDRLQDSKLVDEVEGLRELIEGLTIENVTQVDVNAEG